MGGITITINFGPHWTESFGGSLESEPPESDWVAIDFETATGQRDSACAVGLAHVRQGKVVAVERALIQPPGNDYFGYNIMVHGIEPTMTETAPTFEDIWPLLFQRIHSKPVVAHNASFDFSVLRHCLDMADIEYPELDYYCTRVFSLMRWPELPSHALELVADRCAVEFGHHDPGEDARACAEIALHIARECSAGCLEEIAAACGVRTGRLHPGRYDACSYSSHGSRQQRRESSRLTEADVASLECGEFDEAHPFYCAEVIFTGTLQSMERGAAQRLVENVGGCAPDRGVTKHADYLVVGDVDMRKLRAAEAVTKKMERAMQLRAAGKDIEIIGEREFLELL